MKLYDTLSGQVKEFTSRDNEVKLYVCGITPYASAHVGHAMSYIIFDVLRRYLEHLGYQVKHVQNFTDIDDKIIERARQDGISTQELADRYIDEYFREMDSLNVQRAHVYANATNEVTHMVDMIKVLIEKEYAYVAGNDVYFRVTKNPNYGKLSHRSLDHMISGARVKVSKDKEHPMDFALWKGAKKGEPNWKSPWSKGRPGWHIECSAISLKYLGDDIDIHGGGQDLIFPHHENELAQSEIHTGQSPFARFWLHNGLLQMSEEKMSKSVGNVVTVKEASNKYSPDALRLFVLGSHYRRPLMYSDDALVAASRASNRLTNALQPNSAKRSDELDPTAYSQQFFQFMDNDLNTPQAVSSMFNLAREINRVKDSGGSVSKSQNSLRQMGELLGLTFKDPELSVRTDIAPFIDLLIETRKNLRSQENYHDADKIRQGLNDLGVFLEDDANNTTWKYQGSLDGTHDL